MRLLAFFFSFFLLSNSTIAQSNLDSLWNVWTDQSVEDTVRCKAIDDFIWFGYLYSDTDSALILSKAFYDFAKNQGLVRQQCMALNTIGTCHWAKSSYIEAINYLKQSLELSESINNNAGIASALNNIGGIYSDQGYYTKALHYFNLSKKLHETQQDTQGLAVVTSNIGRIYKDQNELVVAKEHFKRSLALYEQIDDQIGVAIELTNLGSIYASEGNYEEALNHYQRAIVIRDLEKDLHRLVTTLDMTGSLYARMGNINDAIKYHEKSLALAKKIDYQRGYAIAQMSYGRSLAMFNRNEEAIKKCEEAYYLLRDLSILKQQKEACNCLYQVYREVGNEKEALRFFEFEVELNDSLEATETAKKLQQMEFEKLVLADSAKHYASELKLKNKFEKQIIKEHNLRNIAITSGIFALLLALGLYRRTRFVKKTNIVLQRERDRSDSLLHNILPADVAAELKEKGKSEAKDFDNVTVLFTDFVKFTQTAEKLSAKELVDEINYCFEAFDGIITKYKLEKIKTIGDAYMAAGGLQVPRISEPKDVVKAALEMQFFVLKQKEERTKVGLTFFDMRVGIHTGPVVAGIVGVKKFQYDIWGDTVNTASRMESAGEVGKVNISNDTYKLIKDDPQFTFESRGKMEVKGKGQMEMLFVSFRNNNKDE